MDRGGGRHLQPSTLYGEDGVTVDGADQDDRDRRTAVRELYPESIPLIEGTNSAGRVTRSHSVAVSNYQS